jgi:hypothetical protein
VLRGFEVGRVESTPDVLPLEDALVQKVGAALDVPLDEQLGKHPDLGGDAAVPDELEVRRPNVVVVFKLVKPRDGELTVRVAA